MQDPLYTSPYTSACHHPLSSLQAISTMSSLSVHNDEQVDQHWTEEGAVNINDGNDDDGNDWVWATILKAPVVSILGRCFEFLFFRQHATTAARLS